MDYKAVQDNNYMERERDHPHQYKEPAQVYASPQYDPDILPVSPEYLLDINRRVPVVTSLGLLFMPL
jgi:hypothetical protein